MSTHDTTVPPNGKNGTPPQQGGHNSSTDPKMMSGTDPDKKNVGNPGTDPDPKSGKVDAKW